MTIPRRDFIKAARAAALATVSRLSQAQSWPSRIVHLEVGFPPGGGIDSTARIVSNRLSDLWGQQVVIENRPGAGGRIVLGDAQKLLEIYNACGTSASSIYVRSE